MKNFKGQSFVFLGKPGSGKGTQTAYLKEYLEKNNYKVIYVYTGAEGRKLAEEKNLVGKWIKSILSRGDFFPEWMAIFLWFNVLKDKLVSKDQIVIFDGTPRKLGEAEEIDKLMVNLKRPLPIPIYVDIDDKESEKRLLNRGRQDDLIKPIRERIKNFHRNVVPVMKKYGKRVIEVDGFGPKQEVWEKLAKKLETKKLE